MSKGSGRRPGVGYEENWLRIFAPEPPKHYVQRVPGQQEPPLEEHPGAKVIDLMEALKASLSKKPEPPEEECDCHRCLYGVLEPEPDDWDGVTEDE